VTFAQDYRASIAALFSFTVGWALFWASSLNLMALPLWTPLILLLAGLLAIPMMRGPDPNAESS
jgi:hypothetical protein